MPSFKCRVCSPRSSCQSSDFLTSFTCSGSLESPRKRRIVASHISYIIHIHLHSLPKDVALFTLGLAVSRVTIVEADFFSRSQVVHNFEVGCAYRYDTGRLAFSPDVGLQSKRSLHNRSSWKRIGDKSMLPMLQQDQALHVTCEENLVGRHKGSETRLTQDSQNAIAQPLGLSRKSLWSRRSTELPTNGRRSSPELTFAATRSLDAIHPTFVC